MFFQAQDHGTDPGPLNDTKIYHIRVTDYNYYAPVILFPMQGKNIALSQDQSLHTQLKTYGMQPLDDFNASDADYGASGQVTFSISSESINKIIYIIFFFFIGVLFEIIYCIFLFVDFFIWIRQ